MTKKSIPILDPQLFFDVVFENIDYDAEAAFVITRVFESGDVPDIRNCRRYYGDEKVTEALVNAETLSQKRVYLASAVVNRPLKDFKSFKPR